MAHGGWEAKGETAYATRGLEAPLGTLDGGGTEPAARRRRGSTVSEANKGRPATKSLQPQEPRAASAAELHPTPPGSIGHRYYAEAVPACRR